jgi:hypothetical protein
MSCAWNLVNPIFSLYNKSVLERGVESNFAYRIVGKREVLKANASIVMKEDK